MKLLVLFAFALPLFVQAEIKKDAKYEMVDRYCSDGSDAQDAKLSDVLGAVIEFRSNGKYVLYDTDRNYESNYSIEGNTLSITMATADVSVASTIRSHSSDTFSMFSELPKDVEKAKAICPTGGFLVQTFKLKGTVQE